MKIMYKTPLLNGNHTGNRSLRKIYANDTLLEDKFTYVSHAGRQVEGAHVVRWVESVATDHDVQWVLTWIPPTMPDGCIDGNHP